MLAEANRFADTIARETAAAVQKPSFHPPPEELFLGADAVERALGNFTAVEVGSLVTMTAPREGCAAPVEVRAQASLKLRANQLSAARRSPRPQPLPAD